MAGTVLLLGADGFIGRHIAFALRDAGFRAVCVARRVESLEAMGFETVACDLEDPSCHDPGYWRGVAGGATRLINAAGLLKGNERAFRAVHVDAPAAAYAALPQGARVVLISAVGIDADTAFGRWRRAGEAALRDSGRAAAILRPGLVLGETSYGGSSALRAMAAMPWRPWVLGRGDQPFNPLHAADLARLAVEALETPPRADPVPVGGDQTVSLEEMTRALRRWLGLRDAPPVRVPMPLARAMGVAGDALRLGPVSRTSVAQLEHGVLADTDAGRSLPGLGAILSARPAGTQDLWQARLFVLRPAVRLTLALVWAASGLLGLLLPADTFASGLQLPELAVVVLARLGGVVDLAIAWGLLRAWRLPRLAAIQAGVVLAYTVGLTVLAPGLWFDPYGGLLKNLAVLALIAVHAVLERER